MTIKKIKFEDLHKNSLIWDNHGCMPIRADDSYLPELERYRRSGVDIVVLNVGYGEVSLETHIRVISYMRHWIKCRPNEYKLIENPLDIHESKKEGKLGIAFNIEGALAIGDQLSLVQLFYDLGVRWMLLAYNKNSVFAGGCHDNDSGLTEKGKHLIDEMNRVGMVVCCSHMGHKSAMDVLNYSQKPVIFSHSNSAKLVNHPRNISDELILACANGGGVIGVNGVGVFLGNSKACVESFVEQIDYIVELVGSEHVGISLDYAFDTEELSNALSNSKGTFPAGYGYEPGMTILEPEKIPKIAELLIKKNYSECQIRSILGNNFLRIAEKVWQ